MAKTWKTLSHFTGNRWLCGLSVTYIGPHRYITLRIDSSLASSTDAMKKTSTSHLRSAWTLLTQHDPRRLLVYQLLATIYLLFHRSGFDGTGPGETCYFACEPVYHGFTMLIGTRTVLNWRLMQLPRTFWTLTCSATASVSSRHSTMMDFPPTLAADAASCAIRT
jgi:hypothetical protein